MRTRTKILGLAMVAILLVCTTIFGTVAYLTAKDTVTNTFTVGHISITLDEAEVDADGQAIAGAARVKANTYKLLPGKEYDKDPTVHVASGSEAAWLFVTVENGISAIEDGSIATQIAANGWAPIVEGSNVYFKEYNGGEAQDYVVFESFKLKDNLDSDALDACANAQIVITAYAVQKDGFSTAAEAWAATFGA